jgi:mono/diheme cytochrome c family protein
MKKAFLLSATAAVLIIGLSAMSVPSFQKGIDKKTMERGLAAYENNCLACHQVDGSGVPGLNPPLTKTKWVVGDKKTLIDILLKGMDTEIEVNGEVYNNVMPSNAHLSDQEIADVLTYVRNSFGNKASAVTVAEVKAQRKLIK